MSMIGFPLLLIPLAIYNIFVFLMPGVAFTTPIVSVGLWSGVVWAPTFGDALLAVAMTLLLFEIIKASRPGARFLTDHLLSLIVSSGAMAEFLLLTPFGTSTFFLLTVLTAVEFVAGASIAIRSRSRGAIRAAPEPDREEPSSAPEPAAPKYSEPQRFGVTSSEQRPPEMTTISPAPETPKVPPAAAPAERKLSDWSMSDLIGEKEAGSKAETPVAKANPTDTPSKS